MGPYLATMTMAGEGRVPDLYHIYIYIYMYGTPPQKKKQKKTEKTLFAEFTSISSEFSLFCASEKDVKKGAVPRAITLDVSCSGKPSKNRKTRPFDGKVAAKRKTEKQTEKILPEGKVAGRHSPTGVFFSFFPVVFVLFSGFLLV